MSAVTVSSLSLLTPSLTAETVMKATLNLPGSTVNIRWQRVPGGVMPEVVVRFNSVKGGQSSLRYHLPPDSPERTERRIRLLLRLLQQQLTPPRASLAA